MNKKLPQYMVVMDGELSQLHRPTQQMDYDYVVTTAYDHDYD